VPDWLFVINLVLFACYCDEITAVQCVLDHWNECAKMCDEFLKPRLTVMVSMH